jgi:uncharacterized alpha-E superfamily protein
MLSRTADHLYWMARYTERAENTARMLDVNYQMSLMPQSEETATAAWRAMLDISELSEAFDKSYSALTPLNVLSFMTVDIDNPSSIMQCLRAARENARAVRGSITTDLWETINTTWLEAQRLVGQGVLKLSPGDFFEWVKFRSHQSRGVYTGTLLRDEVFNFISLGVFLERSDNIARLLDVKFHAVEQYAGEALDEVDEYYYWGSILRSVSAFENYRKVYRNVITPERVAELLILKTNNPRSLVACMEQVVDLLPRVRNKLSGSTEHEARSLLAELRDLEIEEIFEMGTHAFLTQFLERVNDLGIGISNHFLVPVADAEPEDAA